VAKIKSEIGGRHFGMLNDSFSSCFFLDSHQRGTLAHILGQAAMIKTSLFILIACFVVVSVTFVSAAIAQPSPDANSDAQLNSLIEK